MKTLIMLGVLVIPTFFGLLIVLKHKRSNYGLAMTSNQSLMNEITNYDR